MLVAGCVTNVFNREVGVGENSKTGVSEGSGMKTSGAKVTTSGAILTTSGAGEARRAGMPPCGVGV